MLLLLRLQEGLRFLSTLVERSVIIDNLFCLFGVSCMLSMHVFLDLGALDITFFWQCFVLELLLHFDCYNIFFKFSFLFTF